MPVRRALTTTAVTLAACALAACGSSGGSRSGGSTATSASSRSTTTTSSAAACPGAAWSDVTGTWKALAPRPFREGRQQVAEDLAALRRGQDTSTVGQVSVEAIGAAEPLVVVLAETGVPDPEVVKVQTEITLEGGDEGWAVSAARQRSVCVG